VGGRVTASSSVEDPDPSLFSKNLIIKTEDNVPAGTVSYKKKNEKNVCILKVTEERS
jgi:hypothetical protein